MNYYKRFMGDYAKDTAHLSLIEHGAYTLLLDHYYATEQPLPEDYASLYRICRAFDKKEQHAVRVIADTYFPVSQEGGRINGRAANQLAEDSNRIETARVNGKKGGRPKKETQQEPNNKPKTKPNENPMGFDPVNPKETQQEPRAKAHQRHTPEKEEKHSSAGADHADRRFPEFWESWPRTERKTAKAECLKKWRLRGLDAHADEILRHVAAMRGTRQWLDGYEPAPLTYLNQKRWEDGIPTASTGTDDRFGGMV